MSVLTMIMRLCCSSNFKLSFTIKQCFVSTKNPKKKLISPAQLIKDQIAHSFFSLIFCKTGQILHTGLRKRGLCPITISSEFPSPLGQAFYNIYDSATQIIKFFIIFLQIISFLCMVLRKLWEGGSGFGVE
jgi:hypothetical protein